MLLDFLEPVVKDETFQTAFLLSDVPYLVDIVGMGKFFMFPIDKVILVPYNVVLSAWLTDSAIYTSVGECPKILDPYFEVSRTYEEIKKMIDKMYASELTVEKAVKMRLTCF
jgi:hypothetical protein